MPLDAYPVQRALRLDASDRYGLSWQVCSPATRRSLSASRRTLMFVGEVCGKAEEAIDFYTSVFEDSKVGPIFRYGPGQEPETEGTVMYSAFTLEGNDFAAMDSAREHEFAFNEAISFMVGCETQEEIDYYWERLSAVPEAEQCGWLKDRYGVSWQISPTAMDEMMAKGTPEQIARVTQAFLPMKKYDLAALRAAYEQG